MTPANLTVAEHEPSGAGTRKTDVLASGVVFLVAFPLCMGIAIASGVPVASGLITGMVGGIVVGFLAGAPLQVSGPAAGLTVIIYEFVRQYGIEALGVVVLIGGAIQLVAGLLRLGQWFRAVSPAVIKGMLSGIGILIFTSQFHVMVDDSPRDNSVANLTSIPQAIRKGLPLPKWGTRQSRAIQVEHLKELGALHEHQERIHENVTDLIAGHRDDFDAFSTTARYRQLVSEQQQLTRKLSLTTHEISETRSGDDSDRDGKDRAADQSVARTLAASRRALTALRNGTIEALPQSQQEAVDSMKSLIQQHKNHDWAAKIGLVTILLIVSWQGLARKRLKLIPAPLLAVGVATAVSALLVLPVRYVELPENLTEAIYFPSWAVAAQVPWRALLQTGVVIAIVASAETLLCATAVDQMHRGPRTKYDRELTAQGIGNMVCGLLGALPMTGVIVRSAANIEAGARTRLSAILHGVWLLLFVVAFPGLLRMIPTSALAAMLVYIGYKLINWRAISELWQYGKGEVAIYLATVVIIVAEDLLTGVLVGIVLSAIKLLYTFSHLKLQLDVDPEGTTAVLRMEGAATFIRLPYLASVLEQVPGHADFHVDFEKLNHIDHACLDLLMNWEKQHETTDGSLTIDWDSLHAKFSRIDELRLQRYPAKTR